MATTVSIIINSIECRTRIQKGSLTIQDVINDSPNTCSFVMRGTAPVVGQTIRITVNTTTVLFNGTLQTVELSYEGKNRTSVYRCTATDDIAALNNKRPFGSWTSTSATTIAQALITTYGSGFTSTHVAASLPSISIVFDGSETFAECLARIASLIGGYYYVEDGDLHLFLTEASSTPDTIDSTPGRLADDPPIVKSIDYSQLRTRVYGRGYGSTVTSDIAVGATTIPVDDRSFFSASGGSAISGSNVITYTGIASVAPTALGWSVQTDTSAARGGDAVVWASSLKLFVSVAAVSFADAVMTSPDGFTWTIRTPAANKNWQAIAWSPSLSLLVAVSSTGDIMTSPDGITWTTRTGIGAANWLGIAWSPSLNLFAAVAGSGTNRVMTSPNGVTWTARTAASAIIWEDIVWADTLSLFVACANDAGNCLMTSPDGITWTTRTAPAGHNGAVAMAWSSTLGVLVTVTQGYVIYSTNGTSWTRVTPPFFNGWNTVTWADGLGVFVALSLNSAVNDNRVMVSPDGLTWSAQPAPMSGVWYGCAWSADLSRLVAVGESSGTVRIMTVDVPAVQPGILTGVPASSTGSVAAAINAGDAIDIWVQRDDAGAQSTYGVVEYLVTDGRRNLTTLTALCDAHLALYKAPIVTVTYSSRDIKTKSGKSVTINLSTPAISATLTIQQATISEIDVATNLNPRFAVTASTVRFSLDDLLRQLLTSTATGVAA